jgi:hypothetical protein|tara:strand:- start:177 stop:770 length:594 start_codon:yes stop_codon:yes gene_type:complete
MAELTAYTFNNTGRIGADIEDLSQRTLDNTRYANHTLSNNFSSQLSNHHVKFALDQPTLNFSGVTHGNGLHPTSIDHESNLIIKTEQQRPFEKLQLFQRPFSTVPYLGRGSVDPTLESQLRMGEAVTDRKSTSTIMDKSFNEYYLQPTDDKMENYVSDPSNTVEEAALDGWVRGGMTTREMTVDEAVQKYNRPNGTF